MAVVHVSSLLTRYTGGLDRVTIDAPRGKELLAALNERFPGLGAELEELAVAIDGQIHQDPAYESLSATSEVYFVPKIAGGSR